MNGFDLSTATDIRLGNNPVEVYLGSNKIWPTALPNYEEMYLTFVAHENATFKFYQLVSSTTIQYSINNGSWTTLPKGTATPTVSSGSTIRWKSNNMVLSHDSYYGPGHFTATGTYHVEGNIMSLIYGDNFFGQKSLVAFDSGGDTFDMLFCNFEDDLDPIIEIENTMLLSAENLALPATDVSTYSYDYMFSSCVNLTKAPKYLPATSLADYCYAGMFNGCVSLSEAPTILPATTLAPACYNYMFRGCTSLTTAPELPATTLAHACYLSMFSGCTSLNYVKCLAATGMTSSNCLSSWLSGVSSTGTFVKSPDATTGSTAGASQWLLNSASGIPTNWTVQNAGGSLADPEISWGSATYNYGLGSSSQPVFNNPHSVSVTFTSSDSTVASINSSGVVTYLKRGTVTLTASFSGDSTYYSSTVTCSLTLTGYSSNIGWSSASYSYPLDSQTKPVFSNPNNLTVTFNSSDTSVATINSSGVVTYVAVGTTTLTATFNGNDTYEPSTVTCTLAVTAATSDLLTFDITSSGNIGWKASSGSNTRTLQYRKNGGSWTNITSTTSGATISVANGDKLEFKADNTSIGASGYYNYFTGTANFKVSGYLTSILDADNYAEYDTYGADNIFRYLFYNCTTLTDASGLILPASTRNGCYSRMFQGCTGLVKAPDLPATSIATYAYYHLFDGCSSLNYVKCLATSGINTSSSTTSWMNNVASSGTFVKASGATWPSSTSGIPSSWTIDLIYILPLPNGYTALDYIENVNSAYINTGVNAADDIGIHIEYEDNYTYGSSSNYVVGARATSSSTILIGISGSSSGNTSNISYNGSSVNLGVTRSKGKKYVVDLQADSTGLDYRYVIDGSEAKTGRLTKTLSATSTPICLFGFNSSNIKKNTRISRCYITDGGDVVRYFLPCKNASNVVGLYDCANGVFYGSSNSNTFTEGNVKVNI